MVCRSQDTKDAKIYCLYLRPPNNILIIDICFIFAVLFSSNKSLVFNDFMSISCKKVNSYLYQSNTKKMKYVSSHDAMA